MARNDQGATLEGLIAHLQPVKRGKGSLDPPATRDRLPESVAEAVPQGEDPLSGQGINWPLTEISRTVQTVRVYDPNDATRWIDVEQVTELVLEDALGLQGTLILTP